MWSAGTQVRLYDLSCVMNTLDVKAESAPANHDGLGPARNEAWHILDDDGLTEDCPVEDIPDGSVGAPPHLLQLELLHSGLIWCDGCAFHTNLVFLEWAQTVRSISSASSTMKPQPQLFTTAPFVATH